MSNEKQYYTCQDIMKVMGVCQATAYEIIRQCNKELQSMGKLTVRGKVNAKYFLSKIEV